MEILNGKLVTRDSKYSGIYAIINLKNNKFYIGSSVNLFVRKKGHFNDLKGNRHKNAHLQNAYNIDSKYFIMIEIENVSNIDILRDREQYWIDEFESYNRVIGYNINKYADSLRDYTHSDETREKLRQANLGKKLTDEQRKNISIAGKGRVFSEESKKKISEGNKKTKNSLEYQLNHKKKSTKVIQKSMDGSFIAVWNSITEASTKLKIPCTNIVKCCKQTRKSAGGFIWIYK